MSNKNLETAFNMPQKEKMPVRILVGIKRRLKTRPVFFATLAALIVLVTLAGVLTWYGANKNEQQQKSALAKLAQDQEKQIKKNKDVATLPTNSDVSNLQFRDISDGNFSKPTCAGLENRKAIVFTSGCSYNLRAFGEIRAAVVFVYEYNPAPEVPVSWLTNSDPNGQGSLSYFNTYMKNQAARYKVDDPAQLKFTFMGPYKTSKTVAGYYYRDNSYQILDAFEQTAKDNKLDFKDYDLVHYVFLDENYGGVAYPSMHRAFTYNSLAVSVFTHETLHLLGASDKYYNNDCNTIGTSDPFGRYGGTLPGKDIMCSSFSLLTSNINDITAREIGWAN